ncbi:MAG: DNA polymerase, partial [Chloroflexota bacterium]
LKRALALLWQTRDRFPTACPVLVVHDEIVFECEEEQAEDVKAWLEECMRRGMESYLKKVPVVVDAKVCRDWSGIS